jgi:hypothetical protein
MEATKRDIKSGPNANGVKKSAPDKEEDSDINAKIPRAMITQVTMKAGVFTLTIIFWQLGIGAAAGGANF